MTIRTYIRTDRNGTKYYRCKDFNCQWTEQVRTPEYEAKLQARREARKQEEMSRMAPETIEWLKKLEAEEKARVEAARKEFAEKMAVSQYEGEVGETIEALVTVEDQFYTETRFGVLRIVKFRTEGGNVWIWKTSSDTPFQSKTFQLRAKVKEHKEYKDRNGFTEKQTIITRPTRVK